jgi:hypothetical protein
LFNFEIYFWSPNRDGRLFSFPWIFHTSVQVSPLGVISHLRSTKPPSPLPSGHAIALYTSVILPCARVAKLKRRRLQFIFPHPSTSPHLPFPLKSSKTDGLNLQRQSLVSLPHVVSPHRPDPIKGTDTSAFCLCYTVVPSFLTLLAPSLASMSKKLSPPSSITAEPPPPPRQPLIPSVRYVQSSSSSWTSPDEHQ